MFDLHETALGRTSNDSVRDTRTHPGVSEIGELSEQGADPSAGRGWRPIPRAYDWFGDVDPDGLPDGQDFLDRAGAPSEAQESP